LISNQTPNSILTAPNFFRSFAVQNAELSLQFEKRARIAAEKRLEELIAFGQGKGRGWGRSFAAGAGVDVETQTDREIIGEVSEMGDLWAIDAFGDEANAFDHNLDSAVALQRAAAAAFVMDGMKKSAETAAAGRAEVQMTLPDSPRWAHDCHRYGADDANVTESTDDDD
jgi:hypothetical protein